ncbi:zinc finger protein 808-like [Anoplophora glabripennis]|uniref:zinc finger protein 808-like n=1 Tax=Anoplophora glabripennis TaxID=217634 RepID=UPI00087488D0|nr:zinc finger protein 808-like [Anoplophora glabripennis]XP_018577915.1 zinc finger protein 808-like [Anoplophora glabripennis]
MASFKENTCRLCLATILDKNFRAVDDYTTDILDIPLLKLKFEDGRKHVVCCPCYERLNAALEFKSACLGTYNTILPYGDYDKVSLLDLREIYMKQNGTAISRDQKVCRLCMRLVRNEFRCVLNAELDAIKKFIPEMKTIIIKDPVVCTPCFDSLCTHNAFLKDCSEVGEKVGLSCDDQAKESHTEAWPPDLFIKTENLEEFDTNEMGTLHGSLRDPLEVDQTDNFNGSTPENQTGVSSSVIFIKTENSYKESEINRMEMPIEVKLEEYAGGSGMLQPSLNYETTHSDSQDREKRGLYHPTKYTGDILNELTYKNLTRRKAKHKSPSKKGMYKCQKCDFVSKYMRSLNQHQSKHRDKEVQIYKCKDCDFETRYKPNIASHMLRHRNVSDLPRLKCDKCDYTTIKKRNLSRHQLRHKSWEEAQMHSCDVCDYGTKYKGNLSYHQSCHHRIANATSRKDPSEEKLYKCNDCDFGTNYRKSIRNHMVKHRNISQMPKYKCDKCKYVTVNKINFQVHHSNHKGTSETQVQDGRDASLISGFMRQKIRAILNV